MSLQVKDRLLILWLNHARKILKLWPPENNNETNSQNKFGNAILVVFASSKKLLEWLRSVDLYKSIVKLSFASVKKTLTFVRQKNEYYGIFWFFAYFKLIPIHSTYIYFWKTPRKEIIIWCTKCYVSTVTFSFRRSLRNMKKLSSNFVAFPINWSRCPSFSKKESAVPRRLQYGLAVGCYWSVSGSFDILRKI